MYCLIGSTGFVGSNLKVYFDKHSIPYCTSDRNDGVDWVKGKGVLPYGATVVNLAGVVGVEKSKNHTSPSGLNSSIAKNVVHACQAYGCKLVHMSSYVYGAAQKLPIDEQHPITATNPYMKSKIDSEEIVLTESRELGVLSVILRPFNLYGPYQQANYLIPSLVDQFLSGDEVVRINNLKATRDHLYIDDLARAVIACGDHQCSGDIFNVCSGIEISNKQVIEQFEHVFGKKLSVIENIVEETSSDRCQGSYFKFHEKFGWKPEITFMSGLEKTKDYYEGCGRFNR